MTKIATLTPEQEAALDAHHAEWLAYGLSTEPADRPRAEAAITAMYEAISEAPPAFLWCDSPATCCMAIAVLTAWLIHTDEHGANGIGPGCYALHGKREQADEIRRVMD